MLRRITATLLALLCTVPLSSAQAAGSRYADVPPTDWSVGAIEMATEYGLLEGVRPDKFGFGNFMTRAQFVTAMGRLFRWEETVPEEPTFSDCGPRAWFYSAVETAWANGVLEDTETFRPDDPITREEMVVMLVKALDYDRLAAAEAEVELPFPDVTSNRGYVALAYRFGILQGSEHDGQTWFHPNAYAPREQVAAMLVRTYERIYGDIEWLHAFYAFSSYNQIGLTDTMDGVSVGWGRMRCDPETGPQLNQGFENGNYWAVPNGSEEVLGYFQENGTPYYLCIYAGPATLTLADGTTVNELSLLLDTPEARAQAIALLVAAAEGYAGLTIDFEGLRAPLKEAFSLFMTDLRAALPEEQSLLVCVPPDDWYDGFDYRTLGELCDKVILMAHDYQWPSVPASYVGGTNTDTPVTPIRYVYSALKTLTDPERGVRDPSKLALAIAIAGAGLQVDEDGVLISQTIYTPGPSTVIQRLRQEDTQRGWSDAYRNPYIYYTTEDGNHYRLWYEDARSVMEKVRLAQLLGVNGVSLWRLGTIPNYPDEGLDYDVWTVLQEKR